MNQMNDKEVYHLLRSSGFMVSEINRLIQLRRDYTASKLDEAPLNHARLQFVWWFMRTIMTHDIGYVLSHRPKASGNASHHLVGKECSYP